MVNRNTLVELSIKHLIVTHLIRTVHCGRPVGFKKLGCYVDDPIFRIMNKVTTHIRMSVEVGS